MKTMMLTLMYLMFTGLLNAGELNRKPEQNGLDNQMSTTEVFQSMQERPSEEAEIMDIPFNTTKIAEQAGIDLRGYLPSESDIDDIPFNTAEVLRKYNKRF